MKQNVIQIPAIKKLLISDKTVLNSIGFCPFIVVAYIIFISSNTYAQNPFILDQFTADPSARVFDGKVYVYPSHDIPCTEGRGRIGWFCMEDYHVFSSDNLTDWIDHGVIVSQNEVKWVDPTSYSMWAPDCIYKNGKYYFYFPSRAKDTTTFGRGFSIGVAVSDNPYGPFTPEPEPIKGVYGIDPNPFIDKDGQAYLYWSARNIFVAKLKDNMLELASEPYIIPNLPEVGLKEGPYMFERNGIYYLTYPHVEDSTERLEYAIGDNPMGPFTVTGVIMDEKPGCWTNHQSIIEFKDQWYLFYHHNDLSPEFDKNRSIRIDSLFFNDDGTIQKVIPTVRGVGITDASSEIQVDRYSLISNEGAFIVFIDTLNKFEGWKTILDNGWIQYNSVDFVNNEFKSVYVKASSKTGGTLQIRLNKGDGPLIAEIEIPESTDWDIIKSPLSELESGIHNLVLYSNENSRVEIDWIRFE